jgi:hypothetical protein
VTDVKVYLKNGDEITLKNVTNVRHEYWPGEIHERIASVYFYSIEGTRQVEHELGRFRIDEIAGYTRGDSSSVRVNQVRNR